MITTPWISCERRDLWDELKSACYLFLISVVKYVNRGKLFVHLSARINIISSVCLSICFMKGFVFLLFIMDFTKRNRYTDLYFPFASVSTLISVIGCSPPEEMTICTPLRGGVICPSMNTPFLPSNSAHAAGQSSDKDKKTHISGHNMRKSRCYFFPSFRTPSSTLCCPSNKDILHNHD